MLRRTRLLVPSVPPAEERGQSMIEFALTLPILAILLIGSITVGHFAYDNMIVREAVEEGAKMQMIDRARNVGGSLGANQMSNDQALDWIRAVAHQGDPTIDPKRVCVPGGGGNGAWAFDNKAVDGLGAQASGGNDDFGKNYTSQDFGPLKSDIVGDIQPWLNTGLQTMKINYYFDSQFGLDWSYKVTINYHYTRYAMFTFPFLIKGTTNSGDMSSTCS